MQEERESRGQRMRKAEASTPKGQKKIIGTEEQRGAEKRNRGSVEQRNKRAEEQEGSGDEPPQTWPMCPRGPRQLLIPHARPPQQQPATHPRGELLNSRSYESYLKGIELLKRRVLIIKRRMRFS